MYRCEVCSVILQERYKTKHNQSKEHKYYSSLILNRFVIYDVEVAKFKDVFDPYFIEHTEKLNFFTVCIILWFYNNENTLDNEIIVLKNVTYYIPSEHYSVHTTEPSSDFSHKVISIYYSHRFSPK